MKSIVLTFSLLFAVFGLFAQTRPLEKLPLVEANPNSTLHFISPESIQYVDISSNEIVGDLPLKNILRLRARPDSISKWPFSPGNVVITIAGESYLTQYQVCYKGGITDTLPTRIEITPDKTIPLDIDRIELSSSTLKRYAYEVFRNRRDKPIVKKSHKKLEAELNQVYSVGDYIFLDVSYSNKTNLPFQIDEARFKIEDKKITKATNSQSIEITPVLSLFPNSKFKRYYRNVFVFKKFTYPGSKILNVSLTEKQISGRNVQLKIPYKEILEADVLPPN
ncbi:conjugative transposon protein TraN [Desertivirga xinjiangensis]|uniref:conjugative transposon protein TraN n=1 Tax=Desertivirga xinjiangensis TaxID=539206 RepID=UPI002109C620|nr:conjugative transposon protein TraN [Pedobacter xinjiangensis]